MAEPTGETQAGSLHEKILARFEARREVIAEEIAASNVEEIEAFREMADARLHSELLTLARGHLDAFLVSVRSDQPPSNAILAVIRDRAAQRARKMVPLSALVQAYMIAQRVISAAIVREAGANLASREAGLSLVAQTVEYNIAVTAAMTEAYVEAVQADLAELDSARRGFIDALLTTDPERRGDLARSATRLGFDTDRELVAVLARVVFDDETEARRPPPRSATQAIARCSGRPERGAFVVSRDGDVVAVLDAAGSHPPRLVLENASAAIRTNHAAELRAGIGPPFSGLHGFAASYREAHRAMRHARVARPLVFGPGDVTLFDELTSAAADGTDALVPEGIRHLLIDTTIRDTLDAFFAADLNVAGAALALSLHPNSLRYRLRRIAELTGRDPRRAADLLELITASRLIATRDGKHAQEPTIS